jgi:hypothetical protein
MRKSLLVARNILIIGVMLWMALSYQNNHRFGASDANYVTASGK